MMIFSKEDAEKIRNYGRLSYENGYKDGYLYGSIVGCVITISGAIIATYLSKYFKA
jgi:hypothetical protein